MRAAVALVRFVGWTLCLMPVQFVVLVLGLPLSKHLPRIYHRHICTILSLKVEVRGKIAAQKPTLFVSNHTSYLDISVLGSLLEGSFVAKSEVLQWPLFSQLAQLQRTIFVDRRISKTADQRDAMAKRLETGDSVILFPEGTSSDGNRVLPFKSAYFGVAERPVRGRPLTVQPVSIAYTRLDHMPMGRGYRPYFAWYGDMELMGHLWGVMGLGPATVSVEFHEPVTIEGFASRKELSAHVQRMVAKGVSEAISGRQERKAARKRRLERLRWMVAGRRGST